MKKFICANCDKLMTHGEWKKAGKLQNVREIMFSGFDEGEMQTEAKYFKYCSSTCEERDIFENHLPFFNLDHKATKEHLKEFHGMDFLDEQAV